MKNVMQTISTVPKNLLQVSEVPGIISKSKYLVCYLLAAYQHNGKIVEVEIFQSRTVVFTRSCDKHSPF